MRGDFIILLLGILMLFLSINRLTVVASQSDVGRLAAIRGMACVMIILAIWVLSVLRTDIPSFLTSIWSVIGFMLLGVAAAFCYTILDELKKSRKQD